MTALDKRFEGTAEWWGRRSAETLAQHATESAAYLARIRRFHGLEPGSRLLEVGCGTGWFLVHCARQGLECSGMDHNPVVVEHARRRCDEHGLDLELRVGDVAATDLGADRFDAIVALSVMEHVKDPSAALRHIRRALRPGGALLVYTTSKFSLRSGEYPGFPLYGWLPYAVRVWIRGGGSRDRSLVHTGGMDFNQFTSRGLRRDLRLVGFSRVYDQFEFLEAATLGSPSVGKRMALWAIRRSRVVRELARFFAPGTCVIAIR